MCFKKKANYNKDLFKYACERYFAGNNDHDELLYEEIINDIAQKFAPDMDEFLDKEKDFTVEETCEICRDMAIKTIILFALQEDEDNWATDYIQENYPEELKRLIDEKQIMFVDGDQLPKSIEV